MKEIEKDISGTSTLVTRLSKSERTYITKKLSASKGHLSHKVLFEILVKSGIREEQEIKKLFISKSKKSNYTLIKSQLLELILDSLQELNKGSIDEFNLFKKLERADILAKKQLYNQALRVCSSVLKEATSLDYFALQLKCFELIIEISIRIKSLKDIEFAVNGMEEFVIKQKLYNKLLQQTHHANLVFFTKSGKDDFESSFEAIIKGMQDPEHKSIRIQSYYYHLSGFINLVYKCDYPEALKYFEKNLTLLSRNKNYLRTHPNAFKTAVYNLAICYDHLNEEKKFFEILKTQDKESNANNASGEDVAEVIILKQSFLQSRKKHTGVVELMEKEEKNLIEHEKTTPSELKLVYCINTMMSCIYCREWKKALKWNNIVINDHFEQIIDLSMFNRLVNLIIHYELSNIDLIESLLPNLQRYLSSYGYYSGLFKDIYSFFKEVVRDYEGNKETELLSDLKNKLETISNQPTFNLQEATQFVIDWIDDRTARLK